MSNAPRPARIGAALRRSAEVTAGNSSTPEGQRKHLKANTPARWSGASSSTFSPMNPPEKTRVHRATALGGGALGLERGDCGRGRDAVERHVEDCGDATGGRGAGRAREPLPIRATRVVDVHVGVHQPREDHRVARLDHPCALGHLVERGDRDDATAGNVDRRVANAGRNGHAPPADHEARSGHVALLVSSQNRRSRFAATSRR